MTNLIVAAPLKGWAGPLEEVPDSVFAERMMGDGLAIDPVDCVLYAPFDGEIASLPRTGHAVVVRAENGAEMLMHVGLETVALGGDGFMAHVREGQRVRAGERLLSFDLDLLAQRAKSLITPIVLTNGERFDIVQRRQQRTIEIGEPLMELRPRAANGSVLAGGPQACRIAVLGFAHGLHARPAAAIAKTAQSFAAEIVVSAGGRRANAKSPVSLMTLGAGEGDTLAIEAHGRDAEAAADAVMRALSDKARKAGTMSSAKGAPVTQGEIAGVCAAPGLAVGVAVQFHAPEIAVTEEGRGPAFEHDALQRAQAVVKSHLETAAPGDEKRRGILGAHIALLDDPELAVEARRSIEAGKSAGFAWKSAIVRQASALAALDDPYMRERIADLRDIEQQVLAALTGAPAPVLSLPEQAIVLANDILPSQFTAFDRAKLAGIAMASGGATSHVALLAAAAGVPAIAAAGSALLDVEDGTEILLDADAGVLRLAPGSDAKREAQALVEVRKSVDRDALAHAQEQCRTRDGVLIHVFANLASFDEAKTAIARGAEGCGLLRTEFLFMDRDAPPNVAEQAGAYQAIADALQGRPLTIRTLDAAPDKPVAYLATPHEDNPALGLRGLRASLRQPDLLRAQLDAILQVKPRKTIRILLPMVTDVAEIPAVRAMLGNEQVALGAMIETPAAALLADQLAAELDFLSVGTNDLSQYALAMDRTHPDLAGAVDALHPAVLRLVKAAADGARKHKTPISVCGAAASDLVAAPLLIGLGVDTLSVAPAMMPLIKARLRMVEFSECQALAEQSLALSDAKAVRALAARAGGAS